MPEQKFHFSALILCAIIAVIFLIQSSLMGFTEAFVLDADRVVTNPWILVTSIFLHGSATHLLSNLFALGLFGSILEKLIGTRRFLLYFFATGLLASMSSSFFYASSLGASGAIFGILGVLAALRPKMVVWTYGVPMPMFIAVAFWFLLDFAGVFFPSNTANVAHIAGLFAGLAVGFSTRKAYKEPERKKSLSREELDEWEEDYF